MMGRKCRFRGWQMTEAEEENAYRLAAERLHHLSMRYVGSIMEVGQGAIVPIGLIPQGNVGVKECRDLIDLVLLTRAEINALTTLLVQHKVFKVKEFARQCAEEYEWLAQQKAKQFNVEITDVGLKINKDSK